MTQCWFQQQDSKTNVRSSLISEVAGSIEASNICITQNVSKKDNINLILKESAKRLKRNKMFHDRVWPIATNISLHTGTK